MKYIFLFILVISAGCSSTQKFIDHSSGAAFKDSQKARDIKKLISNSGELEQLYQLTVNSFIDPIEHSDQEEILNNTKKRALWKTRVEKFVYKKVYENPSLIDQLAEIYDKYYSHEEVLAILQFQESPAGKKVRQSKNLIFQESFQIGQSWGQSIMEEFEKEIRGNSQQIAEKQINRIVVYKWNTLLLGSIQSDIVEQFSQLDVQINDRAGLKSRIVAFLLHTSVTLDPNQKENLRPSEKMWPK